jgi:hypothetical protein
MEESEGQLSLGSFLSKCFIHGILFTILLAVLAFFWAFTAVVLVFAGFIIGFIIGLLLLFLIMGGLNATLTDFIWNIPIRTNITSLLVHGLILSIALFLVSVPQILINIYAPSLAATIILFIVYCFIDGYVAKSVAGFWEEEYEETD